MQSPVPNFIPALPVDPSISGSSYITNCSATYSTGYYAIANRLGKIGVYSPTGDVVIANYGSVPDAYLTPVIGDPTATPTPTITNTPTLTPTSTPTRTPTPTPTTPICNPICPP